MTSPNSWVCEGTPKNGKEYSGLGGAHPPHTNDSLDCAICGLPKESSKKGSGGGTGRFLTRFIIMGAVAVVAAVGVNTAYRTIVSNRCDSGLEKIDGECIDPFLQPYQEATRQGNEAIGIADNYQTIEDLVRAETMLNNATMQLTQIPTEALIYPEVETTFEQYKQKAIEIRSNMARETAAREKLQEVETVAQTAQEETSAATTTSQLEAAKQKWTSAIALLQEIDTNTLVASRIPQYQSDYDKQITDIDARIATIAEQNRSRPTVTTNNRTRPSNSTNYRTPTPRRNSTPSRTTTPQPQPKAVPFDPCAVVPKPDNCIY